MASWHLIPKAPRASLILLTGSVVISRPSYPVACRLRGISGIDPAAGEVPREASTSDIILVAVVATRHMSRCPLKASSVCTRTGGLAALPGDLEDLLDAVAGVAGGQPPLSHPPSASGHERRSRPAARRGRSGHGQARPREAPAPRRSLPWPTCRPARRAPSRSSTGGGGTCRTQVRRPRGPSWTPSSRMGQIRRVSCWTLC